MHLIIKKETNNTQWSNEANIEDLETKWLDAYLYTTEYIKGG